MDLQPGLVTFGRMAEAQKSPWSWQKHSNVHQRAQRDRLARRADVFNTCEEISVSVSACAR